MIRRTLQSDLFWSGLAVSASLTAQLIIYRIVITEMSIAHLGLWSLLLSFTMISRFFDFGFATALISQSRVVNQTILSDLATAYMVTFLVTAMAIIAASILALPYLERSAASLEDRPNVVGLFFLTCIVMVLVASCRPLFSMILGLGYVRRFYIWTWSFPLLQTAILAIWPSPDLSTTISAFLGLHLALTISHASLALLAIRREFGRSRMGRPTLTSFKKLGRLAFGFQGAAISLALIEPLGRLTLASITSLEVVGLYEAAHRVVVGLRDLIARSLVYLSRVYTDPLTAPSTYLREQSNAYWYAAAFVAAFAIALPVLGWFWFHETPTDYYLFAIILCVGNIASIIGINSWYWGIGSGKTRNNTICALIILSVTLCSCLLSYISNMVIFIPIGYAFGTLLGNTYLIWSVQYCVYSALYVGNLHSEPRPQK